jgi:hypothetical protein
MNAITATAFLTQGDQITIKDCHRMMCMFTIVEMLSAKNSYMPFRTKSEIESDASMTSAIVMTGIIPFGDHMKSEYWLATALIPGRGKCFS